MARGRAVLTGRGTGQHITLPVPAAPRTEGSSDASKLYLPSHPPQANGCPTHLLLEGGPHRPWKQGHLVKNSGVLRGQNRGDGTAPGAHALGRQVACSEARGEQEGGTGVSRT